MGAPSSGYGSGGYGQSGYGGQQSPFGGGGYGYNPQSYGMGAQGMGNAYGYSGQLPPQVAPPAYAPPAAPRAPIANAATYSEAPDRYAALARALNPSGASNAGAYLSPQPQAAPTPVTPAPAAPDTMRKSLGVNDVNLPPNGYGYGTPGGYQLDTAPSTLDPGSMMGLLGILGGSNWNRQAANYGNWYNSTYGQQAPGGPRAYGY